MGAARCAPPVIGSGRHLKSDPEVCPGFSSGLEGTYEHQSSLLLSSRPIDPRDFQPRLLR